MRAWTAQTLARAAAITLVVGVTAAPADAFVREGTTGPGSSTCLYWVPRNHTWSLYQDPQNTSKAGALPWSSAAQTLVTSSQTWEVQCTDLTFEFAGPTPVYQIGYDPNSSNNINLLIFRDKDCSDPTIVPPSDPCFSTGTCGDTYNCWDSSGGEDGIIALTTSTFDLRTGQIVDADTEFNASTDAATGLPYNNFTIVNGPPCTDPSDPSSTGCVAIDVQNTATHEFGHFLGLAHTGVPDSTMNPSAQPGETSKRTLGSDDIAGICAIYPKGAQTDWCVAPSSSTTATQGCAALDGSGVPGLAAIVGLIRRRRRTR